MTHHVDELVTWWRCCVGRMQASGAGGRAGVGAGRAAGSHGTAADGKPDTAPAGERLGGAGHAGVSRPFLFPAGKGSLGYKLKHVSGFAIHRMEPELWLLPM